MNELTRVACIRDLMLYYQMVLTRMLQIEVKQDLSQITKSLWHHLGLNQKA